MSLPARAADQALGDLEEVVVTARKREESLQEVPVSISVLNDKLLTDAGVTDQRELFQLTPGVHYDTAIDRNSALASVRGVGANEAATNKTKVSAFIDGMPVLGSQGTIQIGGTRQVEFYRGPQSAAFGRSTFGGAINYITKDPTSTLTGNVNADFNDYGRRIYNGTVSGPITNSFGYIVNGTYENSTAPKSFVSTDGVQYGSRGTKAVDGKLVFKPSDKLTGKLTYSYTDTKDGPTIGYFISQSARDACYDGFYSAGMGGGVYGQGSIDCNWSRGTQIKAQNDRSVALAASGVTDPNILFLAKSNSVPWNNIGAFDTKKRASTQWSYEFDNKSSLDFSSFYGTEHYTRANDTSQTDGSTAATRLIVTAPVLTGTMTNPYYVVTTSMAVVGDNMFDPTDIKEKYAEVRWSSPSKGRLKYLLGASYYNYTFNTNIYTTAYGAMLSGDVARYNTLVGFGQTGGSTLDISIPNQIFAEKTTNLGAFFNASYSFTDKLTGTVEGRYASDKVGGFYPAVNYAPFVGLTGVKGAIASYPSQTAEVTTKAFLPRVSFNYDMTAETTFYGQVAKGNNPAAINSGLLSPALNDTLTKGPAGNGVKYVSYDASTFLVAKEETLTNYELGVKGSLFERRFAYSVAVYREDWKGATSSVNLNWDNPALTGAAASQNVTNRTSIGQGDIKLQGIELEGNYVFNSTFNLRATLGLLDAKYGSNYCDVALPNTNLDLYDPSRLQLRTNSTRVVAGASKIRTDYDCYNTSGLNVARQPKVSGTLSPAFKGNLGGSDLSWNARADLRYESKQYIDVANVAYLPSVTTANLSVGLSKKAWNATLYVNNVTDNDTPTNVSAGTDYSITTNTLPTPVNALATPAAATYQQSNYFVNPRAPRTVGLRVAYNFN